MVNPLDLFIIDTLAKTTGYKIDPVVCMRSTIFETINKLYGGWESTEVPMQTLSEQPQLPPPTTMFNPASTFIEYPPQSAPPQAQKAMPTPPIHPPIPSSPT